MPTTRGVQKTGMGCAGLIGFRMGWKGIDIVIGSSSVLQSCMMHRIVRNTIYVRIMTPPQYLPIDEYCS